LPTTEPPNLRLIEEPNSGHVPHTGAVSSRQRAEIELAADTLDDLWKPENLERLARAYWRHLNRISLGLLRVVYEPTARTVVVIARPFALLRFHAPEYDPHVGRASVTWRIERGLLVAREGRGQGLLRISVERQADAAPGRARLLVSAEVRNFYPWLRGSGRLARLGAWIYERTQARIHVTVTNRFLRSLARLDLPPSRVGALAGEIQDQGAGREAPGPGSAD
jgi:hypothetical protein